MNGEGKILGLVSLIETRDEGTYRYYDYKADSEEDAILFLNQMEILGGGVYHQVYTPNCLVGKDKLGLYKQKKQGDEWGEVEPI